VRRGGVKIKMEKHEAKAEKLRLKVIKKYGLDTTPHGHKVSP
jgi:hypothetical protein